ncbi:MAG: hypothetical protein RR194_05350 [Ruthenibacterium sp.]
MKKFLESFRIPEKRMTVVNVVFFFVIFTQLWWLICGAYCVWILCLVSSFRETKDKLLRTTFTILIFYAAIVIVGTLYTTFVPLS